ncbi:helix-turn-helix domain-containing protein [Vibrio astriarenae]|uniref:helix-turn-helix domain-containing protein n=1 Tax=Vibrio astriarenae TaxID=1481923 RepID=UPI003735E813
MSQSLVSEFMLVQTGSPISKLILLKLADNADREGRCFPSTQYLARYCELSVRTVKTHIKRLEYHGFIKKVDRFAKNGRQRSNVYQLVLPELKRQSTEGKSTQEKTTQHDMSFTGEDASRSPTVGVSAAHIISHKEPNNYKGCKSKPTRLVDQAVEQFAKRNPDHPFKARISNLIAEKRTLDV